MAFCAPTTNSYKRLVPGYEAPVNLAMSQRNRSAAARIPMYSDSPNARRVEFRCPDPSANAYLAFAAMMMAGLDGIENRMDPGDPLDRNIYDLPPEEASELVKPARSSGIDIIHLLAPTTPLARSRMIAHTATGFLYYVSVTGVTGARAQIAADLEANIGDIRSVTSLPIGVGFGISTPTQAREISRFADAVVVGSAITQLIENNLGSDRLVATVGDFVASLKAGMRAGRSRNGVAAAE